MLTGTPYQLFKRSAEASIDETSESLDDSQTLIFVHLFKCGGTTLNRLIEWEYPVTRIFSIDPSFYRWSYRRLLKLSPRRLGRMKVFQGHMPFGLHRVLPQKATYLTVLRDPVDRGLSEYYYALSRVVHPDHRAMKQLSLVQYIQATPYANVQTKMLAGHDPGYDFLSGECTEETFKQAKKNLATRFSVVGLTDRFEETLALAKIRFGWRIQNYSSFNVTSRRPEKKEVSGELRSMIAERYGYDMKLYEYASELFSKAVAANRDRVEEELDAIKRVKILSKTQGRYFHALSAARKVITRMHSYI